MPPVPPLMTSNVAVDARGTAWVSRPWGLEAMEMAPLGGTNPGATPPSNPRLGDLWWDSGVNELKVWDGTTWLAAAGGGSGGIADPTSPGSFLRTDTGNWVAGLPLSGAAMTGQITFAAGQTLPGYLPLTGGTVTGAITRTTTGTAVGIDINNTGTGNSLTIRTGALNHFVVASDGVINAGTLPTTAPLYRWRFEIANASTATYTEAIRVTNSSPGRGLFVTSSSGQGISVANSAGSGILAAPTAAAGATNCGIYVDANAACSGMIVNSRSSGAGIYMITGSTATTTAHNLHILRSQPGTGLLTICSPDNSFALQAQLNSGTTANSVAIEAAHTLVAGTGILFRARRATVNHFVINVDGTVEMSSAFVTSMLAALGNITIGDPDSGGTGFRALRVPN